jgi:hypothetical protein
MTKQIIGRGGKLIAIEQDNGSEIVLLKPGGEYVGKYLKSSQQTVKSGAEFAGYGDQLLRLLDEE